MTDEELIQLRKEWLARRKARLDQLEKKFHIPTADVIEINEAVKNAALTIVAAATAAHILKQFFGKESV
jgi:Zn-dependent membrane protease YugP